MPTAQEAPPVTDLLGLAIAVPEEAEAWAARLLASETDPWVLSIARQARGIVLRHGGHLDRAVPEMRAALRLAMRTTDLDRQADVRATLGVTLAIAGHTTAGLDQLARALAIAADPTASAKILMRRGHVNYFFLGKPRAALDDLEPALVGLRSAGDRVWEARTLSLIGLSHLALGAIDAANRAIQEAERLFVSEGQDLEAVITLHNRGMVAICQGDLPTALRLLDEAADGYAACGVDESALVTDRCQALLMAGLAADAVELVKARVLKGSLLPVDRADLLLSQGAAELASDDHAASLASATQARALYRRQRRDWEALKAELAVLLARQRGGRGGRQMVRSATEVGTRLEAGGSDEAVVAWLLAGTAALSTGLVTAPELLEHAARYRDKHTALVRATGWHAQALRCELLGDNRGLMTASRRGLEALDEHRATLGSSELRARATRHGDELARLALRRAAQTGPRDLLEWSERWRANALFQPPVHPPDDDELARDLAALRDTRRRLEEARAGGSPLASQLDEDRAHLELAIRRRTHHLAGTTAAAVRFEAGQLVAALDGTTFVELVDVEGVLHALVAGAGTVRHVVVGDAAAAEQAVGFATFALRQTARGRPSDLADVARRLQATLLGDAVRHLGDGPVVVSPTGRLHATPWALLPALADVPFTVVPSAALWLRARSVDPQPGARVLIAGPRLESGGAEIPVLSERHPEAVVLRDGTATVERCLAALEGAAIAHIAAHGRFRADSPMFSSLELDDGPVTVHDLERLDKAPHRLVLSACESGVVAPIGAGEMLGLASAMLSMGTAGIVSSVAPVNDAATAVLMLDVHRALDDGDDLGTVLLRARHAASGDRVREATAAAFLAMGA